MSTTSGPHTFMSPNPFCDTHTYPSPLHTPNHTCTLIIPYTLHPHPHHTHHTPPLTHRWVSVPILWTANNQAGTKTAVVTMLMMGTCSTGMACLLSLVQLARMETGWVVGWTSVLTSALVMSMCSSQRMENRLGGGGGDDKRRWRGDEED